MSKRNDYGKRHQPVHGRLSFRPMPGLHPTPESFLIRVGQGDYRRPAATRSTNKAGVSLPRDNRRQSCGGGGAYEYVPRRNGLPEGMSWTVADDYRRPGWEARAARAGLDLAAIAAADRELS